MKAIIGKKIGMSRAFDKNGKVIPVTLVEAGPCIVTQVKSEDKDGYASYQMGYGETKKINKPTAGHFKSSGAKSTTLREVRLEKGEEVKLGDKIEVSIFKDHDIVQVTGKGKGKGFQGTVKRHHFHTGPKTHGSDNYRQPGSIGATFPQHTIKGKRMSGHMGYETATVKNLEIIEVIEDKNLIAIKGALPGPNKSILFIKGQND